MRNQDTKLLFIGYVLFDLSVLP